MTNYSDKDTLELLSNFTAYYELTRKIHGCFINGSYNKRIESIENMIKEYKEKPELREGIDLALIALTENSLSALLNRLKG